MERLAFGWGETYKYDAAGQLLRQYAEDPSNKANKAIEHTYAYDPEGNILHKYRSGAGGQEKYDYTHTYDALNRLTNTDGMWGYKTHNYEYDSLGKHTGLAKEVKLKEKAGVKLTPAFSFGKIAQSKIVVENTWPLW